jgi:NAD(P)-dependent dehydrogenase (short-subunit alcohol dehydrogenase family)
MKKEKRIALVTGASRGIGEGITRYLVKKGYFVHATYRKDKSLIEKAFKNNKNVAICHLDVGNEQEVKQVLKTVEKRSGKLHLLVNNAAVDYLATIEDMSLEQWDETFNARGRGTFLMTKYSIPLLKKNKRSTIINITSSFAHETQPEFPAAAAAEAAKMNFTKSCAVALAKYGIRTHSVNPGVTRTPLWDTWGVNDSGWEKMAKENPLGRNCTPEDVAKIIVYLDSDEAAYLNGEEIYTNGGNHLKS